ncbi:MAG: hypothetical protein ACHP8B_17865 [Terriglobales bacterium]
MDEKRYSCEHVVPIEQEPRHHLVIENEFVRAFAVEIAPHDRTLCHRHPHDYLLYVVGDGDIVSAARDEEPKKLSYRDGECELSPAGLVHVVENLRDTPFRNVVVELLPKADSLRRGREPASKWVAAGEPVWAESMSDPQDAAIAFAVHELSDDLSDFTTIRQTFEDGRRAAVYTMCLRRQVEVEVVGPAIVASPYEEGIGLEGIAGDIINLNRFNQLAWLRPQSRRLLRNRGGESARVLVIQLGSSDEQLSGVRKRQEPLEYLRAHADEGE